MGLFSGLGKALKSVVKGVGQVAAPLVGTALGGPMGGVIGGVVSSNLAPKAPASLFSPTAAGAFGLAPSTVQFPTAGLSSRLPVPATGQGLFDLGVPGPGVFSATKPPAGYHLSKRPPYHFVKNRRMNPTNHKAAMRAARRLIAFRKAVMRTEKALRKAVPPSARRARRLPAGHHRHLSHD